MISAWQRPILNQTQQTQEKNIHAVNGNRTRNARNPAVVDLREGRCHSVIGSIGQVFITPIKVRNICNHESFKI
jgi:hypothetical protein